MPATHGFSHLTVRKKVKSFTGPRSASNGPKYRKPGRPRPRPAPDNGRGTIPPKDMPRRPTNPGPKGPVGKRKAAVDYVVARRKRRGEAVSRGKARKIVRKNIRSDARNRAYKYDFAGDGAGRKDEDYGTRSNNRARRKAGFKPVKKNRKSHGGGNGNNGTKGDKTTSADNAGNSQSSDSYGGPQSSGRQLSVDRKKNKKKKGRNRHGQ